MEGHFCYTAYQSSFVKISFVEEGSTFAQTKLNKNPPLTFLKNKQTNKKNNIASLKTKHSSILLLWSHKIQTSGSIQTSWLFEA